VVETHGLIRRCALKRAEDALAVESTVYRVNNTGKKVFICHTDLPLNTWRSPSK
jgi:hypothetical protein